MVLDLKPVSDTSGFLATCFRRSGFAEAFMHRGVLGPRNLDIRRISGCTTGGAPCAAGPGFNISVFWTEAQMARRQMR